MSRIEDIADALAVEALAIETATGDEDLAGRVADAVGTSSPTIEEAFRTAIRMRRAEARGWAVLRAERQALEGGARAPEVGDDAG